MSHPLIEDLALTMRAAIGSALGEPGMHAASGLLSDIDLGLQAIQAQTRTPIESLDFASLPKPACSPGGALPDAGAGPFEDYVRSRTGVPTLRIEAVERISGGFSRDMLRLRCVGGDSAYDIVLRREVPGGLLDGIGLGVAGEYPLIRTAAEGGIPVAAPLWFEADPAILGQPFVAMECVAGRCLGTSLGASQTIGEPQLRALAEMLARLHRLDWHHVATPNMVRATPAAAAGILLDQWQEYWDATPIGPAPILDRAMQWLRDHVPHNGQPPCLTHGDVGFHNIMADHEGFTALLDWEMAVIASPAKDIAHIRPSVEHMVDWSCFIGWYEAAGGAVIGVSELHWFEVFRAFSMTLVCQVALAKLSDPAAARIDYFRLGFQALPVFSQQLAALLSTGEQCGD